MERKWPVIIAIVLGLLAAFLTRIYFQQKEEQLRLEEAAIVIAAKDISKGAGIDPEMLALKTVPLNFIQPGALKAPEAAIGKTALATIMAGEQVLSTKLTSPGAGLTLAGKTPPGKRAFTLNLEAASAVGGMLEPGDHVDVIAIFTAPAISVTLFQNVLVLAVGQEMVPAQEEKRARPEEMIAPRTRETVTLALSPQEVQIITVAMEQGKILLTLRPRLEPGGTIPTVDLSQLPQAIDLNTLLQFYIRQAGPPPPSVEIIRGLKKEVTPVPANK